MSFEHLHISVSEDIPKGIPITVFQSKYDPTHTTVLRNVFAKAMDKAFDEFTEIIKKAVDEQDCFGLKKGLQSYQMTPPAWKEFAFARSQDKVTAFMSWLKEQEDKGLLKIGEIQQAGLGVEGEWTNKYVFDSYKRGVIRARYEMKKAGYKTPSIDETGGIEVSMSTPFHLDRLGLLYTRTFSELKGVTSAMDGQISRVLAQGIADGDNPRDLARKLIATVNGDGVDRLGITDTLGRFIPAKRRANMIARTEIIRAHHAATIQEYQNWAVEGLVIEVEWQTAGYNVCSQCAELQGQTFTLDQIRNKIPMHPNCRCCALPKRKGSTPTEISPVPKKKVSTTQPIFNSGEDSKTYSTYKKQYDGFFKEVANQLKTWSKKDWDLYSEFGLDYPRDEYHYPLEVVGRIKQLRDAVAVKMEEIYSGKAAETLQMWQSSSMQFSPMALKHWAQILEKQGSTAKMIFPDGWGKEVIAKIKEELASSGETYKNMYLQLRALNQSYMETMNIKEVVLYRGTDGKFGEILAKSVEENSTMKRTRFSIMDPSLACYSSDKKVALSFSELLPSSTSSTYKGPRGIMVKRVVPRKDIVVHKDLLSGLTGRYKDEAEFIVLGGKLSISLKDIIWKLE